MIEHRQLLYVVATAELGSFSRAAQSLRIKQSTLSDRLRHLEASLGVTLFVRSPRGASLTGVGMQFLAGAKRVIADIDGMRRIAKTFREGLQGSLTIGISGAVPKDHSQALLLDFSRRHPDIRLVANRMSRPELADGLMRGRLDAVMMTGHIAPAGAIYHAMGAERLYAVCHRDSPIAESKPLYWTDLRGFSCLLPDGDVGDDLMSQIAGRLHLMDAGGQSARCPLNFGTLYHLIGPESFTIIHESMRESLPDRLEAMALHDVHGAAHIDFGLCWQPDVQNPALDRLLNLVLPATSPRRFSAAS